jgi:hypothetical protein
MKHAFLRVGTVNKLSLISERATEIWINKQPYMGINLINTTYVCPWIGHIWQPFTMTSYGRSGSNLSLVHVFHAIPHTGLFVGDPYTIPMNISRGMVRYRLTATIHLRRKNWTRENLNSNSNIPKTKLTNYISDSRFQNLDAFQVFLGNN